MRLLTALAGSILTFQRGTDAFAKCVMQQSSERGQFNQHIVDQENERDAAAKQQGK